MTEQYRRPPRVERSEPGPPTGSLVVPLVVLFLVLGSFLAYWGIAMTPGEHPWAAVIPPAGCMLALIVLLLGAFFGSRAHKPDRH